jgi:hypothetical protein
MGVIQEEKRGFAKHMCVRARESFILVDHTEKRKDATVILHIPNRRVKSLK